MERGFANGVAVTDSTAAGELRAAAAVNLDARADVVWEEATQRALDNAPDQASNPPSMLPDPATHSSVDSPAFVVPRLSM